MVGFVFACIFWLVALTGVGIAVLAPSKYSTYNRSTVYPKIMGGIAAFVAAVLGFGIFFLSGINEVPVRNLGVVTSFGKVEGTPLQPGFHWMAPWKNVNDINFAVQTNDYEKSSNISTTGTCITVRLGGGQQGCADVTIQWQVLPSAANELFADYSSYGGPITDTISKYVVLNNLETALNHTLGDYNPVTDALENSTSSTSQFDTLEPSILSELNSTIGGKVKIISFNLQFINFDDSTQTRLNQIQQQQAATAIAEETLKTNQAISAANAALNAGNKLTEQDLQQECLTTIEDAEKDNYALPAGFSCFSPSNFTATNG